MDAREISDVRAKLLSRRRALWLAGAAGLGAVSACATRGSEPPTTESTAAAPPPVAPAPAAPPSIAPPTPAVHATTFCRDSWGAAPPLPGGRPHTITRLTLHHTAVTLGDNSNAPARLRQHQAFHQNQRGWIDIAYHVSVDRDGNIYQLRTPDIAGDTATNYDPWGHFLVLCEGNFDEEEVSEAQLNGAARVFAWAAQHFNVSSTTMGGHRDASPDTACPGANLYSHLANGDLLRRVDDLITAGGVDLQELCGPEAAAAVAAIEAGTPHQPA